MIMRIFKKIDKIFLYKKKEKKLHLSILYDGLIKIIISN